MHLHIDRRPPPIEDVVRRMKARIDRDGIRVEIIPSSASLPQTTRNENRRQRSLRSCHLPAEPKPRHAPPRDSGTFVPEMSARIEDDRNLTDGARRCARKLAEYIYRKNRAARAGDITVTWLMRALGKSRRTVQRYLRQLERAGYIAVEVLQWRTRMCAGLFVRLLAPLLPRHGWPDKAMKPDAARVSQNYRSNIKTERFSRESWALKCMDGVFRSLMATLPRFPVFQSTV